MKNKSLRNSTRSTAIRQREGERSEEDVVGNGRSGANNGAGDLALLVFLSSCHRPS
ncbi:unnamed protein product [Musa textilis]